MSAPTPDSAPSLPPSLAVGLLATPLAVLPVGVLARHVRLTREAFAALFGAHAELTVLRELSQPPWFAANETLACDGPEGTLAGIRIVGPLTDLPQVVLGRGEAHRLGLTPPERILGDLDETEGGLLRGPAGSYALDDGIIVLRPHLRCAPSDADRWGLTSGSTLNVALGGIRPRLLLGCPVDIQPGAHTEFLIDAEESRAAGLPRGAEVAIYPGSSDCAPCVANAVPQVAPQLITEHEVRTAHFKGQTLWATEDTLITPAAQDADRRFGVIRRHTPPTPAARS